MSVAVRPESDKVFLFVNPTSGGRVGEVFLEAPQPFVVDLDDEDWEVSLYTFSLLEGKSGDKPGFHALRQETDTGSVVRCIVGGGDGTVMWVVGEAERHGIDPRTQMHIGIVPLGTGNDFAQHLGWGGANPNKARLLANDCALLEQLVRSWCKAKPAMHDVWQLSFTVREDVGEIYQKDKPLDKTTVTTPMLLYCGIAKDAEVAYQVELHRTKSQLCNKLVYALMGVRTMLHFLCCRGQRVRRVIGGMYAGLDKNAPAVFEYKKEAPRLVSNPEMLLFLNIDSIAGGSARRLWDTSYRLGVREPIDPDLLERGQDPGDNKLEVITLRRLLRLVMPTKDILAGRRVFQGAPIHLVFRSKRELETYLQVDGESYKLMNPDTLTIQHKQKISVLHAVAGSNLTGIISVLQLFNCTGKEAESPNSSSDEDSDGEYEALTNGHS